MGVQPLQLACEAYTLFAWLHKPPYCPGPSVFGGGRRGIRCRSLDGTGRSLHSLGALSISAGGHGSMLPYVSCETNSHGRDVYANLGRQ
jgi:hypothetical protein